jgi:BirA family transcriptional regulator, biotin operon repressor / biotin---[acetyl-CoA-carboxylase] ligase
MTIIFKEEVTSTQDILRESAGNLPHMTVLRADYQTNGHGQFDRIWKSSRGKNIVFSMLLKSLSMFEFDALSISIPTCIQSWFNKYGISTQFKQPNDLLVDTKKICGILTHTKRRGKEIIHAVFGIGINVNELHFEHIEGTSMKLLTNQTFDIKLLFDDLIQDLQTLIKKIQNAK